MPEHTVTRSLCPRYNPVPSHFKSYQQQKPSRKATYSDSLFRQFFFFHSYFKRYDLTIVSLNIQLRSRWEIQRFSRILFWLFLFLAVGKKKARTYRPVEHRCGILRIADFGPALKQEIRRLLPVRNIKVNPRSDRLIHTL